MLSHDKKLNLPVEITLKSCPYFYEIEEVLGEKPNVTPPFLSQSALPADVEGVTSVPSTLPASTLSESSSPAPPSTADESDNLDGANKVDPSDLDGSLSDTDLPDISGHKENINTMNISTPALTSKPSTTIAMKTESPAVIKKEKGQFYLSAITRVVADVDFCSP